MLSHRKFDRGCRGFGLIELMVAIVIGLIVVGGVTSIVVATLRTNTDSSRMTRLTQDLRASMGLLQRELRAAGYDKDSALLFGAGYQACTAASSTSETPAPCNAFINVRFFDSSGTELDPSAGIGAGSPAVCVIYGYDSRGSGSGDPPDGLAQSAEFRGFRLNGNTGALEMKTSGAFDDATCDAGTWEQLTDPNFVAIDDFSIITPGGAPLKTVDDSTGNPVLTVREMVASVQGHVASDASMSRELEQTVRVRNDLLN